MYSNVVLYLPFETEYFHEVPQWRINCSCMGPIEYLRLCRFQSIVSKNTWIVKFIILLFFFNVASRSSASSAEPNISELNTPSKIPFKTVENGPIYLKFHSIEFMSKFMENTTCSFDGAAQKGRESEWTEWSVCHKVCWMVSLEEMNTFIV